MTKRATFLAEIDRVVPWEALSALVAPSHPKTDYGQPRTALERVLRPYLPAHWFHRLTAVLAEAIDESESMCLTADMYLGRERVLVQTAVCKLQHLLGCSHQRARLAKLVACLQAEGSTDHCGTRAGHTMINASRLTRDWSSTLAPENHRVRREDTWRIGRRMQIGAGDNTELVHPVAVKPANFPDRQALPELRYEQKMRGMPTPAALGSRAGLTNWLRLPRPSSMSGPAVAMSWRRDKESVIAPSRAFALGSSMPWASSRTCLISPSFGTAAWPIREAGVRGLRMGQPVHGARALATRSRMTGGARCGGGALLQSQTRRISCEMER